MNKQKTEKNVIIDDDTSIIDNADELFLESSQQRNNEQIKLQQLTGITRSEIFSMFIGLLFVMNYLLLTINCFALIIPIWNKYLSVYNNRNLLCYTPTNIDDVYLFNNLFNPLFVVLCIMSTLIICITISSIYIILNIDMKISDCTRWLTLLAISISVCSSIASIALSDAFGLNDKENGFIAVCTAICCLSLATIKIILSFTARNSRSNYLKRYGWDQLYDFCSFHDLQWKFTKRSRNITNTLYHSLIF